MRNFVLGLALASTIALAGCATSPLPSLISNGTPGPATVANVQATAIQICAFEPTAATVAKLVTSSDIVTTADAVAKAICNAVTTNVQAEGNVPGRYIPAVKQSDGTLVIIHGRKVKN